MEEGGQGRHGGGENGEKEETGWARASSGKQESLKSVKHLGCAAKLPDILRAMAACFHPGRNRDIKLAEQIKTFPSLNRNI